MSWHGEHRKPEALRTALALTGVVAFLELGGGLAARSLALLADSAHVFMDVVALGIAWIAQLQAARPATHRRTFGFARLEVLAALANAALLLAVTVLIVMEAIHRFSVPTLPSGKLMIVVAGIGASINACIGLLLARTGSENLNVRAAMYHVLGDILGAIGVVIGGFVVLAAHVAWVDPLLSLLVALLVIAGVVHIVREAADILLESTPAHVDLAQVRAAIRVGEGILAVHDLHVWTIGPCRHALSAHVVVSDELVSRCAVILREIDARLRRDFDITHVTMQFECESCGEEDQIVCTQPH